MVPFVAGNWKMHKGAAEARGFCGELREGLKQLEGVRAAVCPPYTALREAVDAGLATFAQSVHWASEGAFTGEISAAMLRELGVRGSIVGHSERRHYFGESDETAARRAAAALAGGLEVIACVGETEEERETGETEAVLRRQVAALGAAVSPADRDRLAIAYEPVWAIGTGRTATPAQAEEAHALIRTFFDVRILYGGSVKPENAEELLAQPDVDGALVGGAALDVESFAAICEAAARVAAGGPPR